MPQLCQTSMENDISIPIPCKRLIHFVAESNFTAGVQLWKSEYLPTRLFEMDTAS